MGGRGGFWKSQHGGGRGFRREESALTRSRGARAFNPFNDWRSLGADAYRPAVIEAHGEAVDDIVASVVRSFNR